MWRIEHIKTAIIAKTFGLALVMVVQLVMAANWPMFRGNALRTGYTQEQVGIPMGEPVWMDSLGAPIISSPSIVHGILYVGARDSSVYAIHGNTGTIAWKRKTKGWVDSSPLIHSHFAIVGSRDGSIYVLDKATGDVLSCLNAGLQLSSPLASPSGEIMTGLGPPLSGLGAYEWHESGAKSNVALDQITYSSPAASGGWTVIGANDGRLYGIRNGASDTAWSLLTKGDIYLSTPAIHKDVVYLAPGNYDHHVYAVDLLNGKLLWKSFGTPVSASKRSAFTPDQISPVLFTKLLRLKPSHRQKVLNNLQTGGLGIPKVLMAKDSSDSTNDSTQDFFAYGGMKTSSVALGHNNVFVIQKELGYPKPRFSILALDKYQGTEQWFFTELAQSAQLGYCSSPIVAEGKVYFGWGEGHLYALDAKTGEKLWSDTLKGHIISSPAISNGKLYVATYSGYVYAYDLMQTADPTGFDNGTYCYPNPTREFSRIQYYLEKDGHVEVRIFDPAERLVKVFRDSGSAGSKNRFDWHIDNAANGVYFAIVTVTYDDGTKDQKILKIAVLN